MPISRNQLVKELEPGLNALFGLEYARYENQHEAIYDIDDLIRLCTANSQYKVPGYRLKKANEYWKQYSIMNIETVKIAKGVVHDIFLESLCIESRIVCF